MSSTYTITMNGYTYADVNFRFAQYADGGIAILMDSSDGPVGKVTVNLETPPAKGCVWIKDYSENEGLALFLESRGLIEATGRMLVTGFVTVGEYRLVGEWASHVA